jgi:DNA polymerase
VQLLFLDFETHYDKEYSLRRMTPAEYILDERFEAICLGAAFGGEPGVVIDGPDIDGFLRAVDKRDCTTITYNALFDNAILAWRYNFVPARMVDGLGMARLLLGSRLRKLGLGDVAAYLELGEKGKELHNVIGMHRETIMRDKALWDSFRAYCLNDVSLLREIFVRLHREFPKEEYAAMDGVLRTCIEPVFHCDMALLGDHLANVRQEKDRLVSLVGASKEAVSGNASFVTMLQDAGIEIETKAGKKGPIPAIAKTDEFMQRLLEDERSEVQCLAAARLGVKSTLEESRCERLLRIASLPWPNAAPLMPIPLRYCGAHTMRLSGDWKINMQNLPSARMGNPILRKSLMAPPGHKILVGDLAQIEARLVAWFSGSKLLTNEFRHKLDPYSQLAGDIFGQPISKETMSGIARHIGKAGILGCGYGMGAEKFYKAVLAQSRAALTKEQMEQLNVVWTPDLAERSVRTYRRRYFEVKAMWSRLNDALQGAWLGKKGVAPVQLGPITISHRDGYGYIAGPDSREVRYPSPMVKDNELWWFSAGVPHRIYGANLLENIIQFLARIILFEIAVRLKNTYGLRFIHQVHDELVFCVPDADVEHVADIVRTELRREPAWAAGLPLDCDIGWADRYGDCK